MSEHDATTATARELERLLRAAAQIGRFLADRRRIALRRAQAASQDRALAALETTERQRRLAAPIWARALDDRFWARAQIEEAAYVYGMAVRFAPVDPSARAAARRCEAEAAARWGARPRGGSEPVDGAQMAPADTFAIAPALPGEEERDWARTLDESARAERAAPAPPADTEAERAETEETAPPDPEMEETAPPDLEAERAETEKATPPDPEAERTAVTTAAPPDPAREEAGAGAAQRPDWSKRGGPAPTRTTARRPAPSAAPPAPTATGRAPADRPTAGRPAAPTGVRAPGVGGPGGRAPAWDSPAARDAWAARMIAAGIDPAAVRAARTGDQALHEPARRATRPAARRAADEGRPRARSASPADTARL